MLAFGVSKFKVSEYDGGHQIWFEELSVYPYGKLATLWGTIRRR